MDPKVEVKRSLDGLERSIPPATCEPAVSGSHFPPGQRAGQPEIEQIRGIRIVFGMLSVLEPQHIPGVLDDHVLKAAAGPHTRDAILRVADGPQGPFHVAVGAAGGDQNRLMPAKSSNRPNRPMKPTHGRSGDPRPCAQWPMAAFVATCDSNVGKYSPMMAIDGGVKSNPKNRMDECRALAARRKLCEPPESASG